MLMGKQRRQHGLKTAGGLLVLLWTETGASGHSLNCTGESSRHVSSSMNHQGSNSSLQ